MENRVLLNLVAMVVLILSTVVLILHSTQLILFNEYAKKASVPGLVQNLYRPYVVWIASFCVSFLSSVMVSFSSCCCYCAGSAKYVIQSTRLISSLNACMTVAALLFVTLASDTEPYTTGIVEFTRPAKGYISYCHLLNQENDRYYPSLYSRCWIYNLTWIGNIILAAAWISLLIVSIRYAKPTPHVSRKNDYVAKLEQHNEHLTNTQRGYPLSNNSSYSRPRKYSTQSFALAHSRAGSMQALVDRTMSYSSHQPTPPVEQSPTLKELSDMEYEADTLLPPMPEQLYHYHTEYFSPSPPSRPLFNRTRSIPLSMTTIVEQPYHSKYQTA